ncbi:hypothetical protein JCM10213v2_006854 [Rhodosporidiobolus nylandii]
MAPPSLPVELWDKILSYRTEDLRLRQHARRCLASKTWLELERPRLYREAGIFYMNEDFMGYDLDDDMRLPLNPGSWRLLQTLAEHSHLRDLVKRVFLGAYFDSTFRRSKLRWETPEETLGRLLALFPHVSEWGFGSNLWYLDEDAPNLLAPFVERDFQFTRLELPYLDDEACELLELQHNLEHLRIGTVSYQSITSLLSTLPSSLSILRIGSWGFGSKSIAPFYTLLSSSHSTLTSLAFRLTPPDTTLFSFLSDFPHLNTLLVCVGENAHLLRLIIALSSLPHLRNLGICHDDTRPRFPGTNAGDDPLVSLSTLAAALPSGISHLCFSRLRNCHLERAVRAVRSPSQGKQLKVCGCLPWGGGALTRDDSLVKEAAAKGVQLEYLSLSDACWLSELGKETDVKPDITRLQDVDMEDLKPLVKRCAECGKVDADLPAGEALKSYCSSDHQQLNWTLHKPACCALQQRKPYIVHLDMDFYATGNPFYGDPDSFLKPLANAIRASSPQTHALASSLTAFHDILRQPLLPDVVFCTYSEISASEEHDAELLPLIHADLRLVVERGGRLILDSNLPGGFGFDLLRDLGVEWQDGGYHRTTHFLNTSHPLVASLSPAAQATLAASYSCKSTWLKNVPDEEVVYKAKPGQEDEVAVAAKKVGEGWVVWVTDVNQEQASTSVMLALAGFVQ